MYNIKIEGTKTTGYIEAVEGAEFTVHLKEDFYRPVTGFQQEFYVDGKKCVICSTTIEANQER